MILCFHQSGFRQIGNFLNTVCGDFDNRVPEVEETLILAVGMPLIGNGVEHFQSGRFPFTTGENIHVGREVGLQPIIEESLDFTIR